MEMLHQLAFLLILFFPASELGLALWRRSRDGGSLGRFFTVDVAIHPEPGRGEDRPLRPGALVVLKTCPMAAWTCRPFWKPGSCAGPPEGSPGQLKVSVATCRVCPFSPAPELVFSCWWRRVWPGSGP